MELWVRSQDKNALYCVKQLRINGLDIMCLGGELLGTYATKERALEVLDEIESVLCFKRLEKYMGYYIINVENNIAIYEMPEE